MRGYTLLDRFRIWLSRLIWSKIWYWYEELIKEYEGVDSPHARMEQELWLLKEFRQEIFDIYMGLHGDELKTVGNLLYKALRKS